MARKFRLFFFLTFFNFSAKNSLFFSWCPIKILFISQSGSCIRNHKRKFVEYFYTWMNFFLLLLAPRRWCGGGDIALNLLLMSLVLNYNELSWNWTTIPHQKFQVKWNRPLASSRHRKARYKSTWRICINEKIAKLQKGTLKIVHFETSAMSETSVMSETSAMSETSVMR